MTTDEMVRECSGAELMRSPRCPRCGARLLRSREEIWCSAVGCVPPCMYGIDGPKRVSDLHADGDQEQGSGI